MTQIFGFAALALIVAGLAYVLCTGGGKPSGEQNYAPPGGWDA